MRCIIKKDETPLSFTFNLFKTGTKKSLCSWWFKHFYLSHSLQTYFLISSGFTTKSRKQYDITNAMQCRKSGSHEFNESFVFLITNAWENWRALSLIFFFIVVKGDNKTLVLNMKRNIYNFIRIQNILPG